MSPEDRIAELESLNQQIVKESAERIANLSSQIGELKMLVIKSNKYWEDLLRHNRRLGAAFSEACTQITDLRQKLAQAESDFKHERSMWMLAVDRNQSLSHDLSHACIRLRRAERKAAWFLKLRRDAERSRRKIADVIHHHHQRAIKAEKRIKELETKLEQQ